MIQNVDAATAAAEASSARAERVAMIRESADRFCALETHVPRARRLRGSLPGYERDVWQALAQLGWIGLRVPESFGGAGLGTQEMAAICEALGRALLPEPLTAASMAASVIVRGDNPALKERLLPAICRGEILPALAWRDGGHSSEILDVQARAVDVPGGGVRLEGVKCPVIGGAGADGYVSSVRSPRGIELYWMEASALAGRIVDIELADGRQAAELRLDGLIVDERNRVASARSAPGALRRAYDEALFDCSAELIGVMERTLEISLDYLRTRSQFGKLIGSYQVLQHRAVDQHLALFTSRCVMREVVERVDEEDLADDMRGALASRLKARCADSALRITREAVQFHGAMGFSDECDVGLYLKRAITLSAWLGGPDFHRRRFAALASAGDDPGENG